MLLSSLLITLFTLRTASLFTFVVLLQGPFLLRRHPIVEHRVIILVAVFMMIFAAQSIVAALAIVLVAVYISGKQQQASSFHTCFVL
jgi:hypothetical protein